MWELTRTVVTVSTNPQELATHNLKNLKAKRTILDVVKDHLILRIDGNTLTKRDVGCSDWFISEQKSIQENGATGGA